MTIERINGPTPGGGDYAVATYLKLGDAGMREVDKADADAMIVSEYTSDGKWLCETVASLDPPEIPPARPAEPGAVERLKALGLTHDESQDSTVIFLGPHGAAASAKKP